MVAKTVELLQGRLRLVGRGGRDRRRARCSSSPTPTRSAPTTCVEFAGLLGIGLRDAGWDGSAKPTNQLAVLPGSTHYDILASPLLAPVVTAFLG